MRVRVPSKRVLEKFRLTYELKGAQKGVNILTDYYQIPKMKIILNGRRVMRGCDCDYFDNVACFTKSGLNKQNVLHELYHHIVGNFGFEVAEKKEEREANKFAREVIRNSKQD